MNGRAKVTILLVVRVVIAFDLLASISINWCLAAVWQVGEGARGLLLMNPSCRVGFGEYNRMQAQQVHDHGNSFCLNADEAPSLPGAYAMAIELTDKAL